MIERTFSRTNRDDFKQHYASYIRPVLKYASSAVYTGLQIDIRGLEKVQRIAKCLVSGFPMYLYNERLLLLNVYPLDIHRLRDDLILTFRLIAEN